MNTDSFKIRHIGPRESDHNAMLKIIGADSVDQLIYETIPDNIKLQNGLDLEDAMSEQDYWPIFMSSPEGTRFLSLISGLGTTLLFCPP